MHYKLRQKPKELEVLEILDKRKDLNKEEQRRLYNLKKGYEGEVLFDALTEKLTCECLILNDLLLEHNHTTFQLDTLMIGHGKIHLFDVKNQEGDYYYESDHLYSNSGVKLSNPLHQLARHESLLQQLLFSLGHKYSISPAVIFIHPTFTMYNSPRDQRIIHPNQIKTYLNQLDHTPSKITNHHMRLADQLISLHQTESHFARIPHYEYATLQKGILCFKCHALLKSTTKQTFFCQSCGQAENVSQAVLRNVEEFRVLFPHEKVTTTMIYEWCEIVGKQRIRRILIKHFQQVGRHRWRYYK